MVGIPRRRGFHPSPGALTRSAGLVAGRSLEIGISLCRDGIADALVTGPLSKSNLNDAGFPFPGQTEMIARYSRSGPPLMLLINRITSYNVCYTKLLRSSPFQKSRQILGVLPVPQ